MNEREGINALIDAAVIVQKLREENDRLRKALREIAEQAESFGATELELSAGRIARRALGDTPDELPSADDVRGILKGYRSTGDPR
jgi:hypothetical protein